MFTLISSLSPLFSTDRLVHFLHHFHVLLSIHLSIRLSIICTYPFIYLFDVLYDYGKRALLLSIHSILTRSSLPLRPSLPLKYFTLTSNFLRAFLLHARLSHNFHLTYVLTFLIRCPHSILVICHRLHVVPSPHSIAWTMNSAIYLLSDP